MSNSCSFIIRQVKSLGTKNITTKIGSTVTAMSERAELDELQKLFELLNTTDNVDLLSQILSAISGYLMFHNRTNIDKIIKCNAVYEKLSTVLSKGSPRKVTSALNFLSAVLYVETEEVGATSSARTLAVHARNMARVSGCLATMSDMFCTSMMYIDVWKALCQCLAVACDQCEMNQSYCTHLVPLCVRKCSQENIDVLLVLQSLLFNHNRNVELFLKSKGMSVFTRELLHYDKCLHLLTTVAQSPVVSPLLFRDTQILNNLYDFIKLYGPRSQIGQKAMIILNHIDARARDIDLTDNVHRIEATRTICRDNNSTRRDTRTINKDTSFKNISMTGLDTDISVPKGKNNLDGTNRLMQNVMKEVFRWKQDEMRNSNKSVIKRNVIGKLQSTMNMQPKLKAVRRISNSAIINRANKAQSNINRELSFSFLNWMESDRVNISDTKADDNHKVFNKFNQNHNNMNISNTSVRDISRCEDPTHTDELNEFVPISVSTPKHLRQRDVTISYKDKTPLTHDTKTQNIPKRVPKYKTQQRKIRKDKDMKNKTLGSRFLSAINESCTTLVKTVKNIFVKKVSVDESKDSNTDPRPHTQFSFTNYMKKRDAVMNNKYISPTNFSFETNSCRTCDDTRALRHKLLKDEHLRQTLKKLKLGINLYGCDFKKISRTFWPRESYVTPAVLYNLYRKLIMK